MAFKQMLDQMLAAGRDLAAQGQQLAEDKLNIPAEGAERDATLSNLGKGALAGGALTLLLGTSAGRKLAGTAAALGGIGALGKVAHDAYQSWKGQQGGPEGTPVAELTDEAGERRSEALFKAMIAAAKADGHIDEAERAAISQSIGGIGLDETSRRMIEAELDRPLSATEVAAGADSPEAAAEIYLASLFVIDTANPAERGYLAELAAALNIQPALAAELESKAAAA